MYRRLFFLLVLVGMMAGTVAVPIRADEYEDINRQLAELRKSLDSSQKATATNEKQLNQLNGQLSEIKRSVDRLDMDIKTKAAAVAEGEDVLVYQKKLLDERTLSHYKNLSRTQMDIVDLITSANLQESLRQFFYQKALVDEDRRTIVKVVAYIKNLEEKKLLLEEEQKKLEAIKKELNSQSIFLASEVSKAKQFQGEVQQKIAQLTAKQQQILAQKLAGLNLPSSIGGGTLSCVDDRKLDPGFGSGFAFFTYGIPHRVGMNQYGAFGRAKAGQDYKTILNTYFTNTRLECRTTPSRTVRVIGFGEVALEEYLKGIYEMPGSWPIEALKAQVVAARSYAITYTNNGSKEICTTQACQVYKGGNKGGDWENAVKQTGEQACPDGQGQVLVSNDTGDVVTAWYASTAGGYTFFSSDVGWNQRPWTKRLRDTTGDISTLAELQEKAYDRDSPCFYSAQGSRPEYNKSAWLRPEEVADITNVLILAKRDSSTQQHLTQVDKPNPDGDETWNAERVRTELRARGVTPLSTVSSVQMSHDLGLGRTTSVTISGDGGTHTFDGSEWKTFFNLRAPANIQIVGGLYNAERR